MLLVLIFITSTASAQRDSLGFPPNNLVYGEAWGNAFYYSVNYARVFRNENVNPCMRAGISIVPMSEGTNYQFPIEVSLLIGKKRSFFELGIGFTIFSMMIYNHASPGGTTFYNQQSYYGRENGANGNFRIGYCFLPLRQNRLMFRVAFTPIFYSKRLQDYYYQGTSVPGRGVANFFMNKDIIPTFGASLGWAF